MFDRAFPQRIAQLSAPLVTRFAPSPTGYLHLGHGLAAMFVWGIGRALDAKVLLRIEDHDAVRCRAEYVAAIQEDLDWLGFQSDEMPPLVQSLHHPRYLDALLKLDGAGQLFSCQCSRKTIQMNIGRDPLPGEELPYPGTCRTHPLSLTALGTTVRLKITDGNMQFYDGILGEQHQNPAHQCGDMALRDRRGDFTYQLCVVCDDLFQGVNLVIRGQDLLSSTGRQLYLRSLLDPKGSTPVFLHHPLITTADGAKLSKHRGSTPIRQLRQEGFSAEEVFSMIISAAPTKVLQGCNNLTDIIDAIKGELRNIAY